MRLIATAIACVLAAFGAAFLIGRAANHQGSATAATAPAHTSRSATRTVAAARTSTTHADKALAAQFEPGLRGLRHKPKVHRRQRHVAAPVSSAVPAPVTTQSYTAPATTYTAPAYSPAPRTTAKPTPRHRSGGSGTTTIG